MGRAEVLGSGIGANIRCFVPSLAHRRGSWLDAGLWQRAGRGGDSLWSQTLDSRGQSRALPAAPADRCGAVNQGAGDAASRWDWGFVERVETIRASWRGLAVISGDKPGPHGHRD